MSGRTHGVAPTGGAALLSVMVRMRRFALGRGVTMVSKYRDALPERISLLAIGVFFQTVALSVISIGLDHWLTGRRSIYPWLILLGSLAAAVTLYVLRETSRNRVPPCG
jgi:predicted Na+-dependent transporter